MVGLIKKFGMEGYGLWWCLIEILHEQGGKLEKFPNMYESLAHLLSSNSAQSAKLDVLLKKIVHEAINGLGLLKENDKFIWSERVIRNIEAMAHKKAQKVEAGRIGGLRSGLVRNQSKQTEDVLEAERSETKQNEAALQATYPQIEAERSRTKQNEANEAN